MASARSLALLCEWASFAGEVLAHFENRREMKGEVALVFKQERWDTRKLWRDLVATLLLNARGALPPPNPAWV